MQNSKALTEYRCSCGKLLCKGQLFLSSVEIKCKRCGKIALFQDKLPVNILHLLLVRDGQGIPHKSSHLKTYDEGKIDGFRLYIIDHAGDNLLF
jgi:phage FluMu protein Com